MTAYAKDHTNLPGAALYGMPFQSGRYYFLPNWTAATTSATLGNQTVRATPFWVPNLCTVSELDAEVTVVGQAASTFRIGIYGDDGTGRPGSLVLDAGTIAGDAVAVGAITGLSTVLAPGVYWIAGCVQGAGTTQPTMRTVNPLGIAPNLDAGTVRPTAGATVVARSMTGVAGALPATWTDAGTAGSVARFTAKFA